MRKLSESEILSLRELMQSETNALIKTKMTKPMVADEQLKKHVESAIMACEGRIKGLQQFINENQVIDMTEVH